MADENRITQYGGAIPENEEQMSEIDKFNLKIMGATDWGVNPSKTKSGGAVALRPTDRHNY
jgi:hypothetical protein